MASSGCAVLPGSNDTTGTDFASFASAARCLNFSCALRCIMLARAWTDCCNKRPEP
jgi:hypothetical protein